MPCSLRPRPVCDLCPCAAQASFVPACRGYKTSFEGLTWSLVGRVEQMGPEIIYVSGRTRAIGEMNGKSANLNNCLTQIYPGEHHIPPHELVCIFDADQVRVGTLLNVLTMPALAAAVFSASNMTQNADELQMLASGHSLART